MSQKKIIIASVLKPLKDTRAYYRFGLSLRETNKYQINIIGFSSKKDLDEKNINFYPIFSKNRNHFSRFLSGWWLLRQIQKSKPGIMIICSWELLPAAVIRKMIWGGKLLYDVQENTVSNIEHNRTMPAWKKPFAKCLVSCIESAAKPFISCFLLAEQCYVRELPAFTPYLVLENKFFGNFAAERHPVKLNKEQLNFLISGTLTEVYGIVDAINWFNAIQETYPRFNLRIIGHCPLPSFKQEVLKACEGRENIELRISETPIAYSEIMEAYTKSDVVLMPYHQIPSIQDKIPSKLYESLAMGKPCLFNPNSNWNALVKKYGAGMEMEFRDLDSAAANLSRFLESSHFSTPPGDEVLWKSDEKKFLDLIEKLV